MWNTNHETRRLMPKKILRSISEDVRDAILSKIPNNWLVYIHITNCINGKKHWFNLNLFIVNNHPGLCNYDDFIANMCFHTCTSIFRFWSNAVSFSLTSLLSSPESRSQVSFSDKKNCPMIVVVVTVSSSSFEPQHWNRTSLSAGNSR